MADPYLHIDPALLAEFLDESSEMLEGLDSLFVTLEGHPDDMGTVEAIFRPVHSIKGNSAFFGFTRLKRLAHEMETLLDLIRKKVLRANQALIDTLLAGVDELKHILDRAREQQPEVVDEEAFEALVNQVKEAAEGDGLAQEAALANVLRELDALRADVSEADETVVARIDSMRATLAQFVAPPKVESTMADGIPEPVQRLRSLLSDPVDDTLPEDQIAQVDDALKQLAEVTQGDEAKTLVDETLETYDTFVATVGFDELLRTILLEKLEALAELAPWGTAKQTATPVAELSESAPAPAEPTATKAAPAEAQGKQHEAQKTMRVAESHIDLFLSYVGELLVVGDMFNHLQSKLEGGADMRTVVSSFRRTNETFAALSNELQRSIMSVRKVSVRGLLQKAPRMVRDIAASTGKEIEVHLEGEDVEVDKSLIEIIDAPLTHMVRNAADHGVETAAKRKATGKPERGNITIAIEDQPDTIEVRVADDGAGLNYDAIRKKAESLGLVAPGQAMRQDDIIALLFSSGVSTAETITDVSGRGVGMDVVKRMIDDMGGSISVESEPGQGSTFRVRLPKTVTTQIMQGYLVESGGQCFVLPMDKINETTQLERDKLHSMAGRGLCVQLHGRVLPVVSLRDALALAPARNGEEQVIVTVSALKQVFALAVDNVLGVQQVVFRELEGLDTSSSAISGGALLGDGTVALIIDPDQMFDRRNDNGVERDQVAAGAK